MEMILGEKVMEKKGKSEEKNERRWNKILRIDRKRMKIWWKVG